MVMTGGWFIIVIPTLYHQDMAAFSEIYSREHNEKAGHVGIIGVVVKTFIPGAEAGSSRTGHQRGRPANQSGGFHKWGTPRPLDG